LVKIFWDRLFYGPKKIGRDESPEEFNATFLWGKMLILASI
jgi:hypothetical protein